MNSDSFCQELAQRIAKYDLLCHPYYKAWSMGQLTRDNLRKYACDYYHHVAAFPNYLQALIERLPDGKVREVVISNKQDEEGLMSADKRPHADIWLDFVVGMGGKPEEARNGTPLDEIQLLIDGFYYVARTGSTAEAIAAFYAYESQVPRVAAEKERGLKELYGADDRTCYYFTTHKTFDVHHSRVWLEQLQDEVRNNPEQHEAALNAAEQAAKSLWHALDGVERQRQKAAA